MLQYEGLSRRDYGSLTIYIGGGTWGWLRREGVSRWWLIWRTYYWSYPTWIEENCVHCCNLLDKTLQCRYPLCPHIYTHRRKGQGWWVQSPCFLCAWPPTPTVRDAPPSHTVYTPLTQNGKTIKKGNLVVFIIKTHRGEENPLETLKFPFC